MKVTIGHEQQHLEQSTNVRDVRIPSYISFLAEPEAFYIFSLLQKSELCRAFFYSTISAVVMGLRRSSAYSAVSPKFNLHVQYSMYAAHREHTYRWTNQGSSLVVAPILTKILTLLVDYMHGI